MHYVTNGFSLGMLESLTGTIEVIEIGVEEAKAAVVERRSIVGHSDTAHLFSSELGVEIPFNRESVRLKGGDTLLIGQYRGPRLPEGTTVLPEGSTIEWCLLTVR